MHTCAPESLEIRGQKNQTQRLEATFVNDWEVIKNEDITAWLSAPELYIQQRATVLYRENGPAGLRHLHRGTIHQVERTLFEGKPAVTIVSFCKMQKLNETYSSQEGAFSFTQRSGGVDAGGGTLTSPTAVRLWQVYDYELATLTASRYWYPSYSSEAWIDIAYYSTLPTYTDGQTAFTDLLGSSIISSTTEIELSTRNRGVLDSFFLLIGSEVIQYSGYVYNQATGKYRCNNLKRGALGTTAASHTAGDTVYFLLPRRIHDLSSFLIEGAAGTTYVTPEAIENSNYKPNYEENNFVFNLENALNLGKRTAATSTAYGSLWGSYSVYDEDNGSGTAIYLGADVFTGLLTSTLDDLGPGFGPDAPETCTANVTLAPDIPITFFTIDRPETVMESLQRATRELGLNKGSDTDTILFRYNNGADTLDVTSITQKATPDRYYSGEKGWSSSVSLDTVRSAIIGWYTGQQRENMAGPDRIWHPLGTVDGGGTPQFPYIMQKWNTSAASHTWIHHSAGSFFGSSGIIDLFYPAAYRLTYLQEPSESYPSLMTDNSADTALGIWWSAAADAIGQYVYFWWPGSTTSAPAPRWIETCRLNLDLHGQSESVSKRLIDLTVYGLSTDFAYGGSSSPPTATLLSLGPNSRIIYQPGSLEYEPQGTEIEINLPAPLECCGIAICINQPMKSANTESGGPGGFYGIAINEVAAYSMRHSTATMRSDDTYSSSASGIIVAPKTHAKLAAVQHLVGLLDIGPATRQTVLGLLFLQMLANWQEAQRWTYTIESTGINDLTGGGVPMIGETAHFASTDNSIVVDNFTYRIVNAARSLTIGGLNYDVPLFASGT